MLWATEALGESDKARLSGSKVPIHRVDSARGDLDPELSWPRKGHGTLAYLDRIEPVGRLHD